ncbi:MAG: hypothetical protein ACXAB2_09005 [Candidatus Hodarchaeales archaeon]
MNLSTARPDSKGYCSFCGAQLSTSEVHKCLACAATFCQQCATRSFLNGSQLKCSCGSTKIEAFQPTKDGKANLLEHIFDLKRTLKQVGYRPVILLKRTGHLESQLRSFRKQFFIPGTIIDKIFLETKKIENFTLSEFQEYASKLQRIYHNVVRLPLSENAFRNSSLQISLFEKHIASFDQTVLTKLANISLLIEQVEEQCTLFEEMRKRLTRCIDKFVLIPGELGIGYFSNIDLQNNGIRRSLIDIIITTDRIVMLRRKRKNVVSQTLEMFDEFSPKALQDVQKKSGGIFKRDRLIINAVKRDFVFRDNNQVLLRIFNALKLSYMGRPSGLYVNEPFRDWSSEIYQEKILSALNFQNKTHLKQSHSSSGESLLVAKNVPDFVNDFLEERLRDLRIVELATKRALEELKEQRKKVGSKEYFELLKQFEFDLAKIAEERKELLTKTGKTNLL